jgi:predicted DNA repair protein MutK
MKYPAIDTANNANRAQIFLIVFAAMVYTATVYGFGTHVVDLQRNGGSLPKAMMVTLNS